MSDEETVRIRPVSRGAATSKHGPVLGPRAWTAATIDPAPAWYYPLPPACLEIFDRAVSKWRSAQSRVTDVRLDDRERETCAAALRPVSTALDDGRGFAVIDRVPLDKYSEPEACLIYWLLGQALGQPMEQNVEGVLLYDVRDTGQDVAYGARFSVTNAESTFHTDNAFGSAVTDYIGLLCLKTAKSGGVNQIVSVYSIYNELAAKQPNVIDVLAQPFHIERRAGVKPGERPTAYLPILSWDMRTLTCRYLRYWIQEGHKKAGQPLSQAQTMALDVIDSLAHRRDLMAEFALKTGEILFVNNRWVLHNRTAFEDHAEPDKRRHYVRIWLQTQK